jgi:hypothetical protein
MDNFKFKTIKSVFSSAGIISKIMFIIAIFLLIFGLAWFVAVSLFTLKFLLYNLIEQGNIWIFISRSNVQYTNPIGFPNTYCNHVAYLTGFWSIIVKYIFGWIVICRLNCSLCSDIREILNNPDMV